MTLGMGRCSPTNPPTPVRGPQASEIPVSPPQENCSTQVHPAHPLCTTSTFPTVGQTFPTVGAASPPVGAVFPTVGETTLKDQGSPKGVTLPKKSGTPTIGDTFQKIRKNQSSQNGLAHSGKSSWTSGEYV